MYKLKEDAMYDGPEIIEEPEEVKVFIYTERRTNYLYEVQFFENFVLVRPATPGYEDVLRKLSIIEFNREFMEFEGNHEEVVRYLNGEAFEHPFIAYKTK